MKVILSILCALFLSGAVAQTMNPSEPKITVTKIDGPVPTRDAYIVKYFVDEAAPGSGYETGSLHILYSDKTEVIERLPPRQRSTPDNIVFNEVGISEPKLAADKRTIAWTENFENCCTSYSIPLVLAVYCSGKDIVEIQQEQMVWNWMFVAGGKHVAAVWGPVHGSDVGDYQLYDPETSRMVEEVKGDKEVEGKKGAIHTVGANAPVWAKELEKLQNGG